MVGPVRRSSLTPDTRAVKARPAPRAAAGARRSKLLEPIKKTRIPEEIADRIRQLILDGTFPAGRPLPSERVLSRRPGLGGDPAP